MSISPELNCNAETASESCFTGFRALRTMNQVHIAAKSKDASTAARLRDKHPLNAQQLALRIPAEHDAPAVITYR
jgi:hypothetical protein